MSDTSDSIPLNPATLIMPPAQELSTPTLSRPDQAPTSREDRIRDLAHEYYEAREGVEGDPVQDWLRAEEEVDREDAK